jgi:uncharacterized protein (TIGR03083 family)
MMVTVALSYDELVAAVEREAAAIAAAFGDGPTDAPVLTCPDWEVRALAHHLGEFTALWTHVVCEATARPKTPYQPTPPEDPTALYEWFTDLARALVDTLRATSGDQPSWTWVPSQQHVGFIARRCANEFAMHRYDAQSARAACTPIDTALAAECVLEIPTLVEGWSQQGSYRHEGSGRSLHLCPTERDHEIVLVLGEDELALHREHTDRADLTLQGTMSDLALVAYDRPPLGHVERVGAEEVFGAWYQEFHFG